MFRSGGTNWRPAPEPESKKPPDPARENEGIHDPLKNSFRRLASSFSLTEKRPRVSGTRRADNQADILTSGFRTFLPPSRLREQSQWPWKIVTRYSGATVLEFHEVPSAGYGWMAWPSMELSKNGERLIPGADKRKE
jgi:hypothetical protein